ncbi:SDR family NAD(P)-dependent oxidoreductase [Streptomyces sp. NPDC102278]|uniref:SDR family NAD(P)-dependent oxidoreductase n=1 Tax=Streptomyces sp. NPDC102278 TaxID=3366152 RepID=UPI0038267DFE
MMSTRTSTGTSTRTPSRFTDKTVLVTGAGSGIGRTVARAFAAEGAAVVVAGRTAASLDETVALIEKEGGTAVAITADVTRSQDVRALVDRTVERFGSLDVAVNNAGVFRGGAPVADLPEQEWRTMLDVNVTGVLLGLQAQVARMRRQSDGGVIVNISSNLGAHTRIPGAAGYLATKAAVSALTRAAALDHIADGVRINAVSPGPSATGMSLRAGESPEDRALRMKDESPLGRVSSTKEIAAAVLYLASGDAASLVGTDLVIDGGASA